VCVWWLGPCAAPRLMAVRVRACVRAGVWNCGQCVALIEDVPTCQAHNHALIFHDKNSGGG
jgi:hypothetical protein